MEGIHISDDVKTLCVIKPSINNYGERLSYRNLGGRPVCVWNTVSLPILAYGPCTYPKNAVKHRIASYGTMSLARVLGIFDKLLTGEGFQIGCESAADKESESENL